MKSKTKKSNSIGLGAFFIFAIVVIVLVSLSFKIFQIVKHSEFDGQNNYYVLLDSDKSRELIFVSPKNKTVGLLGLDGDKSKFSSIGLPFDILVNGQEITRDSLKSDLPSILLSAHINPIDYLKITLFLNQVASEGITESRVGSSDLNAIKALPQQISDSSISEENLTIEVVNATGEAGVGSYFAKQITNLGGNVILVSTQETSQAISEIQGFDEKSSTFKKLSEMYSVSTDDRKAKISDIRFIVGKDLLTRIK